MTAIGWRDTPSDWAKIGDLTVNNNKFPVYGNTQAECEQLYGTDGLCQYMYTTYGEYKEGNPPEMTDLSDFPKYASWGMFGNHYIAT